jgi:hypothetical protein
MKYTCISAPVLIKLLSTEKPASTSSVEHQFCNPIVSFQPQLPTHIYAYQNPYPETIKRKTAALHETTWLFRCREMNNLTQSDWIPTLCLAFRLEKETSIVVQLTCKTHHKLFI